VAGTVQKLKGVLHAMTAPLAHLTCMRACHSTGLSENSRAPRFVLLLAALRAVRPRRQIVKAFHSR
jgi:hypothetical protein